MAEIITKDPPKGNAPRTGLRSLGVGEGARQRWGRRRGAPRSPGRRQMRNVVDEMRSPFYASFDDMSYRDRFDALVDELRAARGVTLRTATIGPPTDPAIIARARTVAGAAWPPGMSELFASVSSVDIRYELAGFRGGAVQIPSVDAIWDYAALEDDLWFDWQVDENPDHPFTRMRPIDRFVEEACAVLYPVPPPSSPAASGPATVFLHLSGETLIPTGLDFSSWLEHLFRSRGAYYWLGLTLGRPTRRTWIEENIDAVAALFPSFDPASMMPVVPRDAITIA